MLLLTPTVRAQVLPDLVRPAGRRWRVLQTKSRQEKALARDLSTRGIEYFLPLHRETRFYAHRKICSESPLFPGYVMIFGSIDEAYFADRTRRVAKIIEVFDQDQFESEVNNLRVAVDGAARLDPFPYLTDGVRVEVRSGPFKGMQGLVEKREDVHRLILQIAMLGQAVSVEIDCSLLDVID